MKEHIQIPKIQKNVYYVPQLKIVRVVQIRKNIVIHVKMDHLQRMVCVIHVERLINVFNVKERNENVYYVKMDMY